jgi:SAM-dependent methyltransferase
MKEAENSYYDRVFLEGSDFSVHYKLSSYFTAWTQALYFLRKIENPDILEVGCGTGQMAHYLFDEGYRKYKGFDFSEVAIEKARQVVTMDFVSGNALDKQNYEGDYNTVICLEVLEHLNRDLQVIDNIPDETWMIFSVPTFDEPSHVRWFTSEHQIKSRYFKYIDIKEISPVGRLYVCFGVKRKFHPTPLQNLLKTRSKVNVSSISRGLRHRLKNWFKLKSL